MTFDCSLVDTGKERIRTLPGCILKAPSGMVLCLQQWLVIFKLGKEAIAL